MVDISDAKSRFEEGITGQAARKWQNNAASRSDDYEENFEPVLDAQNDCAEEAREAGGGYASLTAYADCIQSSQT